jgi:hypothetical protein
MAVFSQMAVGPRKDVISVAGADGVGGTNTIVSISAGAHVSHRQAAITNMGALIATTSIFPADERMAKCCVPPGAAIWCRQWRTSNCAAGPGRG